MEEEQPTRVYREHDPINIHDWNDFRKVWKPTDFIKQLANKPDAEIEESIR